MSSVLVVVDRPYRGVVERQFADPVQLARVCALQFDSVTVLLTGEGVFLPHVETTAEDERPDPFNPWHHPSVNAIAATGSGIHILIDSAATATFGLPDPGHPYQAATSIDIVNALTTHDHVLYA
jgi:hypothetical protein